MNASLPSPGWQGEPQFGNTSPFRLADTINISGQARKKEEKKRMQDIWEIFHRMHAAMIAVKHIQQGNECFRPVTLKMCKIPKTKTSPQLCFLLIDKESTNVEMHCLYGWLIPSRCLARQEKNRIQDYPGNLSHSACCNDSCEMFPTCHCEHFHPGNLRVCNAPKTRPSRPYLKVSGCIRQSVM